MNLAAGLPVLIVSALLQSNVLSLFRLQGGQPDLVLLVVVAWSLLGRDAEGIAWAFAGGLLLDLFSGAPLGVSSVGLVLAAFVAGLGTGKIGPDNIALPPLMGIAGTLIFHVTTLLLLVAFGLQPPTWLDSLSYVTLPSGLLNLVLVLPVFRLMGLLYARLHSRDVIQ